MKKRIALLIIIGLILLNLPLFSPQKGTLAAFVPAEITYDEDMFFTNRVGVSASAFMLMDADSGRVIGSGNADSCLPMASTTKIMTAVVVLENLPLDMVFTIPKEATNIEGSSIYLTTGEKLTCEELLFGLMLESGNDAAVALAVATAGSVEEFSRLMNKKAFELGMTSTHYVNPHGLPDDDHYTTARDLAVLTSYALKNEEFVRITSTWKLIISDGSRYLVNHNKLLNSYEGMISGKTGYTKAAGRCLVTAARREGVTLVAVTLNNSNNWNSHRTLLDFGFEYLTSVTLAEAGEWEVTLPVVGGKQTEIYGINPQGLQASLPSGAVITSRISIDRMLYAPVTAGTLVGEVTYYCGGKPIAVLSLYASADVEIKRLSFFERYF